MSTMTSKRLEELLKALPPLDGDVLCDVCDEIKIKLHRNYPDVPAVIRDPATKNAQPLCARCAIERATANEISFVDIEVALIIRRYFLAQRQQCHCSNAASRWCALCSQPTCDACLVRFLRRSCICERCATTAVNKERQRIATISSQDRGEP